MSFSLTTPQMYARAKTVTRRLGWWKLKAGQVVCAIEQGQGLKKGEKVKRIGPIRAVSARNERLCDITQEEVVLEGFHEMSPADFIAMFCQHHGIKPRHTVRRIEFVFV
jgi:hypothetical protein